MNKILRNFTFWLDRIGRKDGYIDYVATRTWTEEDEICFTALIALAGD